MRLKQTLFLAGAIVIPLLVGLIFPQATRAIRTGVASITEPLFNLQTECFHFIKVQVNGLADIPMLRKKAKALEHELQRLKSESITLSELKQENERLNRLLTLKSRLTYPSIAARIIGRDPSSYWSQIITINKGAKDKIHIDTVVAHSSGLVGKVMNVEKHSAQVILLIDHRSRVSGIDERTRDVGVVEGTGDLVFKMTSLDKNAQIQVGDTVLSSGFGGIYPKGIPIGRIQAVGEEANHLSLYALVEPFVSFSKLEEVICILSRAGD